MAVANLLPVFADTSQLRTSTPICTLNFDNGFCFGHVWHSEDLSLSAYQISTRYLNPRPRYYYFGSLKTNGRHIEFYFRFPFWPFHCHRHVILHWPAKFSENWMITNGVMTSYWLYKMATIVSQIYFHFWSDHVWHLKRSKAICVPNFDQTSQPAAEILLLPVSENKRKFYFRFTFWLFRCHRRVILRRHTKWHAYRTIDGRVMTS